MNWYKRSQYNTNWDKVYLKLKKELGRDPTNKEVQEALMQDIFNWKRKWNKPPVFANKWKDKLPGGLADKKDPSDYEKSQVEKGKNVEFEHTNDPDVATEIAMDHLEEHKDYYIGLDSMEEMLRKLEKRNKSKNNR
jgi:hypothetical protein